MMNGASGQAAMTPGDGNGVVAVVWCLPAQPMTVMFVRAVELMGIAPSFPKSIAPF